MKTRFSKLTRAGVMALGMMTAFTGSVVAAPLKGLSMSQSPSDSVQASDGRSPVIQVQSSGGIGGQGGMGPSAGGGGDPPPNFDTYGGDYTSMPPTLGERSYYRGAPDSGLCWRGGHQDGTGLGRYVDCPASY